MLNLNTIQQALNENEKKINELKKELHHLEELETVLKKDKALLLHHERCVLNAAAFFNWTERPGHARDNYTFYEYKTPVYNFDIEIKERTDLKVWKYEVKAKVTHNYFEWRYNEVYANKDSHTMMKRYLRHEYDRQKGHIYHQINPQFPTEQKFKTRAAAVDYVHQWQKRFNNDFREEIRAERELFIDARKTFNDDRIIVHVDDYKERATIKEYLGFLGLELIEKRCSDLVTITGDNARDKMESLIRNYGFKAQIRVS